MSMARNWGQRMCELCFKDVVSSNIFYRELEYIIIGIFCAQRLPSYPKHLVHARLVNRIEATVRFNIITCRVLNTPF